MADADFIAQIHAELSMPEPCSSVICTCLDYADCAALVTWDKAPDKAPAERLLLALDAALAALADVRQTLAAGMWQEAGRW
jgi:hypothetical protein